MHARNTAATIPGANADGQPGSEPQADRHMLIGGQLAGGERTFASVNPATGAVLGYAPDFSPDSPFGGYKQSGIGREMGTAGLEEFLERKTFATVVA